MALYRGTTKLAGIGSGFAPTNSGSTGQVLTKTTGGYDWETPQTITVDSALSDSSENPVQNKVINSALQNLSVASDHLEERALVGEKYALTDTLFKQLTPKLADCTVDANVGNVAANTEVHIQRLGSGTASNKLKLKVKKVGSPTTSLYVEVRKGIQVDVSDSEAYWYGDSSNIIATGSLASSSFSSSYAEVEFTLDNNFGGTEGELLDVVVYQSTGSGATIDASNYYVLACDSTQWSEAFSYVKVNGSTRSREKLMPYCVSGGFVQTLFCKVASGTVSGIINLTYTLPSTRNFIQDNTNQQFVLDIELGKKYDSQIVGKIVSGVFDDGDGVSWSSYTRTLYANGIQIGSHSNTGDITVTNSDNITIPANGYLTLTCKTNDWRYAKDMGYKVTSLIFSAENQTITISKTISTRKSLPRELKELGNKCKTTLLGYHIDNTWYDGE